MSVGGMAASCIHTYLQEHIGHIVQHSNDQTNGDHVDCIADEQQGHSHAVVRQQWKEVLHM